MEKKQVITPKRTLKPPRNTKPITTYAVYCWVNPSSGFDLAKKNSMIKVLKDVLREMPKFENTNKQVEEFEKKYEGLALGRFEVTTDMVVKSGEDLVKKIRDSHPEAILFSWEPVPKFE